MSRIPSLAYSSMKAGREKRPFSPVRGLYSRICQSLVNSLRQKVSPSEIVEPVCGRVVSPAQRARPPSVTLPSGRTTAYPPSSWVPQL